MHSWYVFWLWTGSVCDGLGLFLRGIGQLSCLVSVYRLIWQCIIAKLHYFECTVYTCLSTHVYALYRLYMLNLAVKAKVRRMCHIQGSIRLHVDIRSIIRIWKSVCMPSLLSWLRRLGGWMNSLMLTVKRSCVSRSLINRAAGCMMQCIKECAVVSVSVGRCLIVWPVDIISSWLD